jgi:ectoine hydroxylase
MFSKIKSKLRDFKITYLLYNFFQRKKLEHNKPKYKQLNIKKPVFWNVSSEDFSHLPQTKPWLDNEDGLQQLINDQQYQQFPETKKQQLRQWVENGFIVLKNFISEEKASIINHEIENLLLQQQLKPLENGKIMFAYKQSAIIDNLMRDERIISLFEFIFKQPVIPFQTINFIKGSQQRAHSDSIHMTTYPLGYLSAAWFALEDVDENNGSLFYYPGSHKLPYVLSPDFDHKTGILKLDPNTNLRYENKIDEVISQHKLVKQDFHAKKGDVFLWHANLIHGGNPIGDNNRTRKSMVAHYFAKNVVKYHEISQRPALLTS